MGSVSSAALRESRAAGSTASDGRYELLELLGEGGMAVVYRARDTVSGAIVAWKQLQIAEGSKNAVTIKALFEREYHTLVRLKHPHIVEAYDYGVSADGPYYAMELLDGDDLRSLGKLPYRKACALLRDVASALALIHAHRLVHRDVSPANVRITPDGHAKLIDFGALAGFGPSTEVVGTPMCVAPEVLRRLPLDQRTDLYALGAVAYFILTGRPAFAARRLDELPAFWLRPPEPPSHHAPDVPAELDGLVLALLETDPMARPKTAAAVIDQLTAIAQLPPEAEPEQAAESYLLSGRMVGRELERVWMKRRLVRALAGQGSQIVLEGGSGIGKTRLLRELCVDAQLEAMVTLSCDAQALPAPYGVVIVLAHQLTSLCPEIARRAAEPHAALLGHLSAELAQRFDVTTLQELAIDPNERRALFQTALHEWFIAVVAQLPVLIAVDNTHAADEDSAAFLAALGKRAPQRRLVVMVAQGTAAQADPEAPLRALNEGTSHLRLGGLSLDACEELTRSLFGDVANCGRLAKLLHERSGGNPRTCMDLARLLVRKRIAQYSEGAWVLPFEVSEAELPSRASEIVAERLRALSPETHALCQALSIHARPVSLERCLSLHRSTLERDTMRALDELVAEQILIFEGGNYRFEQALMREAILAGIDPARRRELHMNAGEAILAGAGDSVGQRVEAAGHLMQAGEEGRGADILANAGREFLRSRSVAESLDQVVRAIATALDVYERQGRSEYEIASLMFPLLPLAFFIDRHITLKYGERAVAIGLRITGLGLAQRLSRYLGKTLGLIIGLVVAGFRFAQQKRRGLDFGLPEAIGGFCGIIPATVGTRNIHYDIEAVRRLAVALEPLRLFGPKHIACLMHEFALVQLKMGQSREGEALALLERLDRDFQNKKTVEVLGEAHWKLMYGGILFSLGILHPFRFGARALDVAQSMDALSVRVWSMAADQIRMLYHALRGESVQEQMHRERVELFAVQGSTTWQAEMFWPVLLLEADVRAGDVLAARRIWKQLERRSSDAPALEIYADAAQAAYLGMRGELDRAIAIYERVLPKLPMHERVAWASVRASYAATLNAASQHQRAKTLMQQTLASATPEELTFVVRWFEPQRQLALAEAGLGDHASAVNRLEALLRQHGGTDQPLLIGLLHKARAQVAIAMVDKAAYELHAAAMEQHFRRTKNPALIAQCARLTEEAVRASIVPRAVAGATGTPLASDEMQRWTSELAHSADPADYALRWMVESSHARAGFLYLYDDGRLLLTASTREEEPPAAIRERLTDLANRFTTVLTQASSVVASTPEVDAFDDETIVEDVKPAPRDADPPVTQFSDSVPPTAGNEHYETQVLVMHREGEARLVGGVILQSDTATLALAPGFMTLVANALGDRQ